MAFIGQMQEFNSHFDDWNIYSERLEQFFEINDFPEVKRTALLISLIGTESYKTLRDLCHPELPKDKTYEELIEKLSKHFMPQISVFRERIKFYQAKQKPNESINTWYARIKKLSIDCRFRSGVEEVLLDRFICGLKQGPIVDRLCEEDENLTLAKALEIALAKESSTPQVPFTRPRQNPENFQQPNQNEQKPNQPKKCTPKKPNQCNVNVNVVAAGKTAPKSNNNNNSNSNAKKKANKDKN